LRHGFLSVIVVSNMRSTFAVKMSCALLFLFAALYSIEGSTLLTSEEIRARMVLEAFRRAYPEKIETVEWRDGDWTATVGGKVFYWARGRLLPASERVKWASYRSYVFYSYPAEPRDPKKYSEEKIQELRELGDGEARLNGEDHHLAFHAALYGGRSRAAVESNLVKTPLFGRNVSVHKDIADAVSRVDAEVTALAARDPVIKAFIAGIGTLGAYNWREIRGTARRSYHSWGLAIDVQPKRLGSAVMYWEWERARNRNWMLVPLEKRWSPPLAVIKAFERQGFVWGGKWDLYDNMHFEYRPELHELTKVFTVGGGTEALIASLNKERPEPPIERPPFAPVSSTGKTGAPPGVGSPTGVGGGELERKP
jgi:hypothetical protein